VLVMRARYAKARVQGSRSGEGAGRVHLNLVERGEGFGDELAGGQMGEAIFAGLVRSCSDSERRAASHGRRGGRDVYGPGRRALRGRAGSSLRVVASAWATSRAASVKWTSVAPSCRGGGLR
jgi:hypothetical protein